MSERGVGGNAARWSSRPLGRVIRVAAVLVAVLLGVAGTASAHSALERSDPPDGGLVAVGRTEITLWFGEPVVEGGSAFTVRSSDPSAAPVPIVVSLGEDGTVVQIRMPPLERGIYAIDWAVVSEDGHPARGTVGFGAGRRPVGATAEESGTPDPWAVALRLLDLGGVLIAIGALVVSGRVLVALGAPGRRVIRRALALGTAGAAVSLLAALATPAVTARAELPPDATIADRSREAVEALLDTTWGHLWSLRLATLALACGALWRARRGSRPDGALRVADPVVAAPGMPSARVVAAVVLVACAGLDAWAGHASTLPARTGVAAVAATLHVVAAGVWAGALIVLVVAALPLLRLDRATRSASASAVWRAYSPMAAVSAGVLVSTGIYEAGRHLGPLSTLTSAPYGRAVVAKVVLVAVALAVASHTTLVVHPRLADRLLAGRTTWRPHPRRLGITVTLEAVVLAVAVSVAALMTSVPTAREVAAAEAVTAPDSRTADGVFVTFESLPAGAWQHVIVRTEAVERPMPDPVTGVDVGVAQGAGSTDARGALVTLGQVEPGHFEGVLASTVGHDWTARVVLRRPGGTDTELLVPWTSGTADGPTRLELVATALAAVLLAGLVAAVAVARRRRAAGQAPGGHQAVTASPEDRVEDLAQGPEPLRENDVRPISRVGQR